MNNSIPYNPRGTAIIRTGTRAVTQQLMAGHPPMWDGCCSSQNHSSQVLTQMAILSGCGSKITHHIPTSLCKFQSGIILKIQQKLRMCQAAVTHYIPKSRETYNVPISHHRYRSPDTTVHSNRHQDRHISVLSNLFSLYQGNH